MYMEVDCSDNGKEVCSRNGVKGYPTLKVFRRGQFEADYVGPRHAGCPYLMTRKATIIVHYKLKALAVVYCSQ